MVRSRKERNLVLIGCAFLNWTIIKYLHLPHTRTILSRNYMLIVTFVLNSQDESVVLDVFFISCWRVSLWCKRETLTFSLLRNSVKSDIIDNLRKRNMYGHV